MANSYKTPGVYVEEIPKLPQSVADVPTAIPGFVGYTEFASSNSDRETPNLLNVPTRISSLLEYECYFGKAPKLVLNSKGGFDKKLVLYDSIRLFYDNGGGVCYIVSIGDYNEKDITPEKFMAGLEKLKDIDETTLLVMPDAATCLEADKLASVQQAALKQCMDLQDRFAILDVKEGSSASSTEDVILEFRNGVGTQGLEYGAAYYPYISTAYTYGFTFSSIVNLIMDKKYKNKNGYDTEKVFEAFKNDTSSCLTFLRAWKPEKCQEYINGKDKKELKPLLIKENIDFELAGRIWGQPKSYGVTLPEAKEKEELINKKYEEKKSDEQLKNYIISQLSPSETFDNLDDVGKKQRAGLFLKREIIYEIIMNDDKFEYNTNFLKINPEDVYQREKEEALKSFVPFYDDYVKEFADKASVVPPSGAIAGIYAQNDSFSGVWKAPANMSIASVRGVSRLINNQVQEDMNVHSTGKSVNAIRAFSGKGVMVWGARTLKGNDNEWRYIPVRRLFNYVEESVQESTEWAVFSPNTQNTWTKIKSQIENFLMNIWRAGGLAGATPEQAYYVNCGLNTTMDVQDINEGRLIVEIGMAAVRPAEFIVLRFSHKLQES